MTGWMFAEALDDACEDGLDPRWCIKCKERATAAVAAPAGRED